MRAPNAKTQADTSERRLCRSPWVAAAATALVLSAPACGGENGGQSRVAAPNEATTRPTTDRPSPPQIDDAKPPAQTPSERREPRPRPTGAAARGPETSERRGSRARDEGRRSSRPGRTYGRRLPRAYRPEKGEAVVPDKARCTGPDVFDQPGCETVVAR